MKVLLTGASGFVGSHILDKLRAKGVRTAVLLRPTSDRRFLTKHLPEVEIRVGSIADPNSLHSALKEITHVIHCAGCTKARTRDEFFEVNQLGTRNVVSAINAVNGQIQRFVHISSLAVTGPATPSQPAREDDPLAPISEYGRSKLAAELEVKGCRVPYTILRPPAVYGPRDNGFLPMFKAVKRHLRPQPSASQALSLVFGPDLAGAIVLCLEHPRTEGKTYFAASEEIVTGRLMANEIAAQMKQWTVPCPLPATVLWPVCAGQELFSRITGRAMLLNMQKYAELRAPGWVCDSGRLKTDTGYECTTRLTQGISETLRWYLDNGWL